MKPAEPARDEQADLPGPALQAFAVAGGMAAWGVAVLTAYPMVQIACVAGQPLLVHLVRWIATVVAVAATVAGRRVHREARAADGRGVSAERIERLRFVGVGGMLLSASGVILLVVEDLATWVIDPCL